VAVTRSRSWNTPERFYAIGQVVARSAPTGTVGDLTYSMLFEGVDNEPVSRQGVRPARDWPDNIEIEAAPIGFPCILSILNGVEVVALFPGGEKKLVTVCGAGAAPFFGSA
jgi:hypothetical protein